LLAKTTAKFSAPTRGGGSDAGSYAQRLLSWRWVLACRELTRRCGFDLVRYPAFESLDGHLASLLRRLRIDCVLDVGAHYGEYALSLRRHGYAGRIVSFEPVADSFRTLSEVARQDANWTVHRLAVGACEEERLLNVPSRSSLASFLPPSAYSREIFGDEIVPRHQERVSVTTLDSFMSADSQGDGRRSRLFLKIDAQGFDAQILDGAEQALRLVQGLQTEVALKPLYNGVTPYLSQLGRLNDRGFELTGTFPVVRDSRMSIIELDCVFARCQ
jgi:FkbM family methyltransferase